MLILRDSARPASRQAGLRETEKGREMEYRSITKILVELGDSESW